MNTRVSTAVPERDAALTSRLAEILRGDFSGLQQGGSVALGEDLVTAAHAHGVLPLVHHALHEASVEHRGHEQMRTRLAELARTEAAVEAIRAAACREVLTAFDTAGLSAMVFKGGALAYTHYPKPDLRPRDDTDLLVDENYLNRVHDLLVELGYQRSLAVTGTLVSHQRLYSRIDGRGILHNLDVHWRVSNRHRYAAQFALGELLERSAPVPELTPLARCPCSVDAVLIASLHRASHRGTDRLIWLYDVHLLLNVLSDSEAGQLAEQATLKALTRECHDAIAGARQVLATPVSAHLKTLLSESSDRAFSGANTVPGVSPPRTIDIWLSDLRALPSWRARLTLLKEHAFPPAEYMLQHAGTRNRLLLPMLYMGRTIHGALKLFRRD